jgi:ribosomal protein L16/L10AE
MRGAFGKPLGTVARVNIGQTILSIRSKPQHKAACIEAFRRAKMKFPGRQKVCCGQISSASFCKSASLIKYFTGLDLHLKEMGFHQV